MPDSNIIATLIATRSRTERAFGLAHNQDRYLAPTADIRPSDALHDGQNEDSEEENPDDDDDAAHRLKLSFDKPPKDVRHGYVFGWGPNCDIQLVDSVDMTPGDRKRNQRVNRGHFSITFDAQRRVILRDHSIRGTAVSYDGLARNDVRSHFTWIILPGFEMIEVIIPRADISFQIKLESHGPCEPQFLANVDRLFPPSVRMGDGGLATPMLQLDMQSQNTSVATSGTATPRQGPIYFQRESIGEGAQGTVCRVVDVSSGTDYAGKFFKPSKGKPSDKSKWDREVKIMKGVKHEHIVRFVDFCETPDPLLVMEYLPSGDLANAHDASPITFEETLIVLSQGLQAVQYLNSHGFIHRDIKPANILLSSRHPLAIKVADFGLAKHNPNGNPQFQSWLGTEPYAAPEIWTCRTMPYTYAVDIWSLGIVALELAYGLPSEPTPFNPAEWFRRVFEFVEALHSDLLINFLTNCMLRVQPEERLDAGQRLEEVRDIQVELGFEQAPQAPSTPATSQYDSGTITEKTSVLNTRMWVPQESRKRQRSPDSRSADFKKKTAVRRERDNQNSAVRLQTYLIVNASLFFDGQRDPVYESVLELLTDIQIDGKGATDSRTCDLVQELCQKFRRLQIVEIIRSIDHNEEGMILTAVTTRGELPLARLTSSDRANSVPKLAEYLGIIVNLLGRDHQAPEDVHETLHEDAERRPAAPTP